MFSQYLGHRARVKGDEFPGELHILHSKDYGCRVYQSARHQLPSGWLRFVLLARRLTLTHTHTLLSLSLSLSEDGAVHVWRDYCQENSEAQKPTLVTAWRGLLDMLPVSKSKIPIFHYWTRLHCFIVRGCMQLKQEYDVAATTSQLVLCIVICD